MQSWKFDPSSLQFMYKNVIARTIHSASSQKLRTIPFKFNIIYSIFVLVLSVRKFLFLIVMYEIKQFLRKLAIYTSYERIDTPKKAYKSYVIYTRRANNRASRWRRNEKAIAQQSWHAHCFILTFNTYTNLSIEQKRGKIHEMKLRQIKCKHFYVDKKQRSSFIEIYKIL